MLGKLYHTFAVVSIAILLAGGALLGVRYGTGKLTSEDVATIVQVLRGEPQPAPEAAPPDDDGEDGGEPQMTRSASAEEIRRQRREDQLHRALVERSRRDLIAQQELLDRALQELIIREEELTEHRTAWEHELEQQRGAALDEGFEKEMQYTAKLPPKQAKAHLLLKWDQHPADAVRLLAALPTSTGRRILEQMKTPDEIQIMHELLERLSQEDVDINDDGSGMTAGK